MKFCKNCNSNKAFSEFGRDKHQKDGMSLRCRQCNRERARKYDAANCERRRRVAREYRRRHPEKQRAANRKSRIGVTEEQFQAMFVAQNGRCAICGTDKNKHKQSTTFHADHCHATGKFRGLLCHKCNAGLGHFDDEPERLEAAAAYLRSKRDIPPGGY